MLHIAIEGLDGTGKSTLAGELFNTISGSSDFCKWVYLTKEPGNAMKVSPGIDLERPGFNARNTVLYDPSLTPLERELLFYVDASQHRRFIENQGNAIVISDRGFWSHLAYLYATMKTKQIDYEEYLTLKKLVYLLCPKPDVVIYLQGSLELMNQRNANKAKDLVESNGQEFFEHVLSTYESLSIEPKPETSRVLSLDAKDSTIQNVNSVIEFLKEGFTVEELKSGTITLCNKEDRA